MLSHSRKLWYLIPLKIELSAVLNVPAAPGSVERAVGSLGAARPRHRPASVAPLQHVLCPASPGGVQVD